MRPDKSRIMDSNPAARSVESDSDPRQAVPSNRSNNRFVGARDNFHTRKGSSLKYEQVLPDQTALETINQENDIGSSQFSELNRSRISSNTQDLSQEMNMNDESKSEASSSDESSQESIQRAEDTLNVVLELDLNCVVKYISKSWEKVAGTSIRKILKKPISQVVLGTEEDKNVFKRATQIMLQDDTSYTVRFLVHTGDIVENKNILESGENGDIDDDDNNNVQSSDSDEIYQSASRPQNSSTEKTVHLDISNLSVPAFPSEVSDKTSVNDSSSDLSNNGEYQEMEGQGILIHDWKTGEITHSMWILKPFIPLKPLQVELPKVLAHILGSGTDMFASYLTSLSKEGVTSIDDIPLPPLVLCRICEQQVRIWWLEKHSELCLIEHQAESNVSEAHDALKDHREIIYQFIETYELQESYFTSRSRRSSEDDSNTESPSEPDPNTPERPHYNGLPLPPVIPMSYAPPSPRHVPATALRSHKSSPVYGLGRNPLKLLYRLIELCDIALDIHPAEIRVYPTEMVEIRAHSPKSEMSIRKVKLWEAPTDENLAMKMICEDTERLAKCKAESVVRLGSAITYSEKIRRETDALVMEKVNETVEKLRKQKEAIIEEELPAVESESNYENDNNKKTIGKQPSVHSPISKTPDIALEITKPDTTNTVDTKLFNDSYLADETLPITSSYSSTVSHIQAPAPIHIPSRGKRLTSYTSSSPATGNSTVGSARSETPKSATSESSTASFRGRRGADESRRPLSNYGLNSNELEIVSNHNSRSRSTHKRSTYGSPIRHLSPGPNQITPTTNGNFPTPTMYSMPNPHSPMSSIHRSHKLQSINSDNSSNTPAASPLFLALGGENFPDIDHRRKSSNNSDGHASIGSKPPLSPLLMSSIPPQKATTPSIRDYQIVNSISKGAFGSVYLAKRKLTAEYFAIKVLKKADMIAKNQVTNVKAERAIMMAQSDSPYVAKLYYTFQSKDYLFLVMEYLNGGDFASLLKTFGTIPDEKCARQYIAEIVVAINDLHQRGIVHRDLKPDNFLIDHNGHLKLTDFGLSRMGLVKRQARARKNIAAGNPPEGAPRGGLEPAQAALESFMGSVNPSSANQISHQRTASSITPFSLSPISGLQKSVFMGQELSTESSRSSSGTHLIHKGIRTDSINSDSYQGTIGSISTTASTSIHKSTSQNSMSTTVTDDESMIQSPNILPTDPSTLSVASTASLISNLQHHVSESLASVGTHRSMVLFDPKNSTAGRKFVGTPDYLAPETIQGIGQDESSDWWSLGCILFEFMFGFPPFHASTPDEVFSNILTCDIQWLDMTEEEEIGVCSPEAKDLIIKLLNPDPENRLGSNGADEIKSHAFFEGVDWENLFEGEVMFVPNATDPESTDYFDARGADLSDFPLEMDNMDQEVTQGEESGILRYKQSGDSLTLMSPGGSESPGDSKSKLLPLHIPPHIRERRLSMKSDTSHGSDQFGSFQFRNLSALEKANKDIINRLKTEHLEYKQSISGSSSEAGSSSLPGTPIGHPRRQRRMSSNYRRSKSPSANNALRQYSPTRAKTRRSKESLSPLLVSNTGDVAYSGDENLLSGSSGRSSPISGPSLQSNQPSLLQVSIGSSNKSQKQPGSRTNRHQSSASTSATPSKSKNNRIGNLALENRRSVVGNIFSKNSELDISPYSSDADHEDKSSTTQRVRKRRQSLRVGSGDTPGYHPLEILVGDSNPLWRYSLLRMLEKLGCVVVPASEGDEVIRKATGGIKFSIIFTELKYPKLNGEDLAKLIRQTNNPNSETPIIAVTAFAKEAIASNAFDGVIEKPFTLEILQNILEKKCSWKVPTNVE